MLFSAFGYFTNKEMKDTVVHLGFPCYFRLEVGATLPNDSHKLLTMNKFRN